MRLTKQKLNQFKEIEKRIKKGGNMTFKDLEILNKLWNENFQGGTK